MVGDGGMASYARGAGDGQVFWGGRLQTNYRRGSVRITGEKGKLRKHIVVRLVLLIFVARPPLSSCRCLRTAMRTFATCRLVIPR